MWGAWPAKSRGSPVGGRAVGSVIGRIGHVRCGTRHRGLSARRHRTARQGGQGRGMDRHRHEITAPEAPEMARGPIEARSGDQASGGPRVGGTLAEESETSWRAGGRTSRASTRASAALGVRPGSGRMVEAARRQKMQRSWLLGPSSPVSPQRLGLPPMAISNAASCRSFALGARCESADVAKATAMSAIRAPRRKCRA